MMKHLLDIELEEKYQKFNKNYDWDIKKFQTIEKRKSDAIISIEKDIKNINHSKNVVDEKDVDANKDTISKNREALTKIYGVDPYKDISLYKRYYWLCWICIVVISFFAIWTIFEVVKLKNDILDVSVSTNNQQSQSIKDIPIIILITFCLFEIGIIVLRIFFGKYIEVLRHFGEKQICSNNKQKLLFEGIGSEHCETMLSRIPSPFLTTRLLRGLKKYIFHEIFEESSMYKNIFIVVGSMFVAFMLEDFFSQIFYPSNPEDFNLNAYLQIQAICFWICIIYTGITTFDIICVLLCLEIKRQIIWKYAIKYLLINQLANELKVGNEAYDQTMNKGAGAGFAQPQDHDSEHSKPEVRSTVKTSENKHNCEKKEEEPKAETQ